MSFNDAAVGVRRFIIGLGKKALIANTVVVTADRIFAMRPSEISAAHAWLGVTCYTVYIYFNLSGYADMAIGLGRILGFRLPELFLWPYISDSMQEFWRRWLAALSAWFGDYVFVPTFVLFGLWHGPSWTFVAWGLFHGMFLVFERRGLADIMRYLRPSVRHAYVMLVVMVGWVLFRADTLPAAVAFLKAMVGLNEAAPTSLTIQWYLTADLGLALAAGVIGSVPIVPILGQWRDTLRHRLPAIGVDVAAAAALAIILAASVASFSPAASAHARYVWLGVSPSPSVVLGKDSWLFYADDHGLEDFANDSPLSEQDLVHWRAEIMRVRDWLQNRGVAYVVTFALDKYRVYPEEFPESIRQLGSISRLDQVYTALSDTRVTADTRQALSAATARERTYDVTGEHWNDRGAFAAYQAIIIAVRAQNPSVPPPWPREDFDAVSRRTSGKDLAAMIGLKDVLREDELSLVPKRPRLARVVDPPGGDPRASADRLVTEIAGSTLPRAVVFRDGFAGALVPFLSEHFSRVVYISQNDVDSRAVLREHPDVVIQETPTTPPLFSLPPPPNFLALTPSAGEGRGLGGGPPPPPVPPGGGGGVLPLFPPRGLLVFFPGVGGRGPGGGDPSSRSHTESPRAALYDALHAGVRPGSGAATWGVRRRTVPIRGVRKPLAEMTLLTPRNRPRRCARRARGRAARPARAAGVSGRRRAPRDRGT